MDKEKYMIAKVLRQFNEVLENSYQYDSVESALDSIESIDNDLLDRIISDYELRVAEIKKIEKDIYDTMPVIDFFESRGNRYEAEELRESNLERQKRIMKIKRGENL